MRLQLCLASAAAALAVGFAAPPASAQGYGDYAGAWSTSEGGMTLSSNGSDVSGTYTQDNGRIEGQQDSGRLVGYWGEDGSAQDCGYERLGTRHWGRLEWNLSPDGSHFSGAWSYCDGQPDRGWTGDRTGGAPNPPPPLPPPQSSGGGDLTSEPGIDRPGQDYTSFDLSSADPELCRQACAGDNRCMAYTYVHPGVQGPNARCWLKSGVPDQVTNNCCVSGVHGQGVTDMYPPSDQDQSWRPDHHGGEPRLLLEIGNPDACAFTDHAGFDLDRPTRIQRLELWYKWAPGQGTLDYVLSGNGGQVASGTFQRGSCDPYQTSWCQALDQPDANLAPGHYEVHVSRGAICQNAGSNGQGFIKLYGW